jgi:hypothetical protein
MATDTIIESIHKFREEYANRFNNDLKAICEDARKRQGQDGRKVIPAAPRRIKPIPEDTKGL